MTKMNKINYKVVSKDGKILDDVEFNDYDKLADHMLQMADKYYQGIYTVDDKVNISAFDEAGNIMYEDTASFGGNSELTGEIEDELRGARGTAGQGFGNSTAE